MPAHERLRQLIDAEQQRLRQTVPPVYLAVPALLRERQQVPVPTEPDAITGLRTTHPGWNLALRLCLESSSGATPHSVSPADTTTGAWARTFMLACDQLMTAKVVLDHGESGFMRLVESQDGLFDAWIATKRLPAGWRELDDLVWWAAWLARQPMSGVPSGENLVRRMVFQPDYPEGITIGGCDPGLCREVLIRLIDRTLRAGDPFIGFGESALVASLAEELAAEPETIAAAFNGFVLDRENAAWHAAVPGFAPPPLIRLDAGQVVADFHGLTGEPLLFLMQELRRKSSQEYHNTAYMREDVFRQDVYACFAHKRFVTSPGRIQLRRANGGLRTDIDAALFDRKTGTLALFELKSQDPFARSIAEEIRQRDNFLQANRQVSAVLDWLNQHGANDILNRIDTPTAKRFRVHKVYPFVLGRYRAHFHDGPPPDKRAAWGSWPQVLRLLDGEGRAGNTANPIASLFARLQKDPGIPHATSDDLPRRLSIGPAHLTVHASYAAMQERLPE